ncbi:hypothetical protein FYC62_02825 [Pedobacter aquae]|uniref:Periplasmic heavy metal sensor n=1 Tax=Pedobacter aquae TaxID=2605747 RepID=A0A5C0VDA9_9SPHI|nr:hypothetical protein [Pedobacter aquae]QEK50715.1 hypothetical protein FYC62_02825 [Pedobacter aquae]
MNRSKDNFFKIGFIFLLLMNCFVLWYLLEQSHPRKNTRATESNDRIVQELKFDAVQEKAFFELKETHMKMNKALKMENRLMRQQLFSLLKDSVVNQEESKILIDKIARNQKIFEEATFEHFSKVRRLCKPQQQQKFDKMIDGILQHLMGNKPEGRPHQGPPPPHHPPHPPQ